MSVSSSDVEAAGTLPVNCTSTDALTDLDSDKPANSGWKFKITVTIAALVALCVVTGVAVTVILAPPSSRQKIIFPVSKSPLGKYRFASVAADAGLCSQIGTGILAKGGSAVDGAIAATICTGVYNMHNSGLGGGFFMTIWDQIGQKAYVVDARETAPLNSTETMFDGPNHPSSTLGAHAIAVPGEVLGLWEAHQKFGRVPWSWLFQPTIDLCNDGLTVSKEVASAIEETMTDISKMTDKKPFETLVDYLTNPSTKKPYKQGEVIYCKKLAATMTRLAADGGVSDYFNGSLAKDILDDLHDIGSPINATDWANYKPVWREPIKASLNYNGNLTIFSTPPPGSGAILSFIINILTGYKFDKASSQDTLTYHRFVEALKFGYAKRTYLGDESFVKNLTAMLTNLTSPAYGNYIRSMINDSSTHPTAFYDPDIYNPSRNHGTSHISVIDGQGNAAAITATINLWFGSGVMGGRTGIIFNDEMDDFSSPNETNAFGLPPSPNNFIKPGKRPQSSTCPAVFLVDNTDETSKAKMPLVVSLVAGAAGGSRITSGTAYIATRVLMFGENVKEAIDATRLHHQLIPETLYYEYGMPEMLLESLRQRGHVNQTARSYMSTAQAVQRLPDGTIQANSDFRKSIAFTDGF